MSQNGVDYVKILLKIYLVGNISKNKTLIFFKTTQLSEIEGGWISSKKIRPVCKPPVHNHDLRSSSKNFNFLLNNQSFWCNNITGLYNRNKGLHLHTLLCE